MKAAIASIIIKERIRKDITKISDLAEDIKLNGLINPVTVMAIENGEYQLLAGLRRIKAVQSMGLSEIEIRIVLPADAEAALHIEVSENEQREGFTFSEKMDYARMFERIERTKADERKKSGVKPSGSDLPPNWAEGKNRETRSIVGGKIGLSGTQYDRAKYVSENAPADVIEQLDNGERSVYSAYKELKAQKKMASPSPADDSADTGDDLPQKAGSVPIPQETKPLKPKRASEVSEEEQMKYLSAHDREVVRKQKEFAALPPEGKIAELERQLFDMRVRANAAESDLETLKYEYGIKVDHKDSIIDSLKQQVSDLTEALVTANKRIEELEK